MSNARTLASLIDTNNKIQVPSGGIQFADATNANTVANQSNLIEQDGYEEGTWTPICENSSGTQTTMASGVGKYTKIGNIVFLTFGNRTDHGQSLTAGGNTRFSIKNLPFTQAGGSSYDFSSSSLVNFADPDASYSVFNLDSRSGTGSQSHVNVYNKSSVNFSTGDPLNFFHVIKTS